MNLKDLKLTWLGHATFRIETPAGKTVIIDPWVMNNPMCPAAEKRIKKVDVLLCTHGHGDHIGDAVEICKQHNPVVIGIPELARWLGKKGAKQLAEMNKGGTQTVGDIKVTMVHADHSCGIQDGDEMVYGGEACGYVVEFSNGVKALSRRRHQCFWRHGDHSRALRTGDCHVAHRRSLHHGPARSGLCVQSAEAEGSYPHALRNLPSADGASQRVAEVGAEC